MTSKLESSVVGISVMILWENSEDFCFYFLIILNLRQKRKYNKILSIKAIYLGLGHIILFRSLDDPEQSMIL